MEDPKSIPPVTLRGWLIGASFWFLFGLLAWAFYRGW